MARPEVPHCKACRYLQGYPWERGLAYEYKQGVWRCSKVQKHVGGQEIRTSPKWCPKRKPWLYGLDGFEI